ncbi:MAG: CPBP family intramembrane metalloprotease [Clostridia bacterium]|nr:CPBP family intramembrane metalloprotease [Clostridia bacterium]
MYEEQEDRLSLDFHTGMTPEKHFSAVVNMVAFLSLLLIVFYVGMAYISHFVLEYIHAVFQADKNTCLAVIDVWNMFEYICSFLLPVAIVLLIFRDRIFRPYIPFRPSLPKHAISAIFMTVGILYVFGAIVDSFFGILASAGLPLAYYETPLPQTPLRIFLYFISSVILPAFVEEMIFRGYILHLLLPHGKTFAILVSAVLFGLMHLYLPQLLYATIAGVLIGYFVVVGESLWIGILIHAVNNLFAFLFEMAGVFLSENSYVFFCVLMESIIFFCGIIGVLILFRYHAQKGRIKHLENGSVYSRLLDTPTALRRSLTFPMICYLLYAGYHTVWNSFIF